MSNQNWKKNVKNNYNNTFNKNKKRDSNNKDDSILSYFKGRKVEVFNGDVNGAIRRLKKILERMDFQKELAKREFYEKPSVKRKRMKDQAKKRQQRENDKKMRAGEMLPVFPVDQKHLKGKRGRRKISDLKHKIKRQ